MTVQVTTDPVIKIRTLDLSDYDAVFGLLSETDGISIRCADTPEAIGRYLARNPGLSFVALSDETIIGCIFGGHDGRRGYLQHLAVAPTFRGQGLAKRLVTQCIDALENVGIHKSHVDVLSSNSEGRRFWAHLGWHRRDDILRFSFINSDDSNV